MTNYIEIDDIALNKKHLGKIVVGVMFGVFLAGLDATIVGTAMPTVISNLGGMNLYTWVFSVYMLMTAVSMPLFEYRTRLTACLSADRSGRYRMLNIELRSS